MEKPIVFIDFSRCDPAQNDLKTMRKRSCKNIRKKNSPKSILTSILASQNLPKSLQNPPGTRKNGVSNEACFATLWKSPANRRKSTELIVCKAFKWLGIWLGLLHPSIHPSIDLLLVALIIKVSPSTWNASRMFRQRWPKSSFWRPKSASKSSSGAFKIHWKSNSKARVLQRVPSNLEITIFGWFLESPGPPKIEPKSPKCEKTTFKKSMLTKNMFSNTVLYRF